MNDHIKLLDYSANHSNQNSPNSSLSEFESIIEDFDLEELTQVRQYMDMLISLEGNYEVIPIKHDIKIKE